MKYTVIGAGGIGGAIGAYLAAGGKDVTLIARGEHLRAIQENGLKANTVRLGELRLKVNARAPEDALEKSDVVFVCVKGYSLDEIVPAVKKAADDFSVVIPILNSLNAGKRLGEALPELAVLDGCVYTSSFVSEPGVITQPVPLFRIVFGPRGNREADMNLLEKVAAELNECKIDGVLSTCIERDIFKKFTFISAFAATDSYFDATLGALQKPGKERDMFLSLLGELKSIADAKKLEMDTDIAADSIKMLDGLDPAVTSSMHKDILAGKRFEKQELVFDVVELARDLGVQVPQYEKTADHFGYDRG